MKNVGRVIIFAAGLILGFFMRGETKTEYAFLEVPITNTVYITPVPESKTECQDRLNVVTAARVAANFCKASPLIRDCEIKGLSVKQIEDSANSLSQLKCK